jgi:cysteinyl-tRNA synthetase, unknown class
MRNAIFAPMALTLALATLGGSQLLAQTAEKGSTTALTAAKSWGYQLQNVRPDALAAAPYDVIVIDYSRDGTEDRALTRAEVVKLKVKPDGSRRVVLAYLSIGEAETYRYYWHPAWEAADPAPKASSGNPSANTAANSATNANPSLNAARQPAAPRPSLTPPWLGDQNKRWKTNVLARFWYPEWQAIIFRGEGSYLDRIINAGFDGIYLDRVDVYQEFEKEKPNARDEMIDFVLAIAERARSIKPGFLVVPQNAEELLEEEEYRAVIDGIAKEDLLFGDGRSKYPNSQKRIETGVRQLERMTDEGKPVFVVEYIDKPEDIVSARKQIEGYGFIPHFANRGLDIMRIGDVPPAIAAPRPRAAGNDTKAGKR